MWLPLTTRDIGSVGAPTVKTTGACRWATKSVGGHLGRLGAGLAAAVVGCRRARRSRRGDHATTLAAAPRGDRLGLGLDAVAARRRTGSRRRPASTSATGTASGTTSATGAPSARRTLGSTRRARRGLDGLGVGRGVEGGLGDRRELLGRRPGILERRGACSPASARRRAAAWAAAAIWAAVGPGRLLGVVGRGRRWRHPAAAGLGACRWPCRGGRARSGRARRRCCRRRWPPLRSIGSVCTTMPRPPQCSHCSEKTSIRPDPTRLRVICTRPSEVTSATWCLVRSRPRHSSRRRTTRSRLLSSTMSMKSMTMMPPMSRSRSWRTISSAASRLFLVTVSSRLPPEPTNLPVLTSTTVIASVRSMTSEPPEGSHTLRSIALASDSSMRCAAKTSSSAVQRCRRGARSGATSSTYWLTSSQALSPETTSEVKSSVNTSRMTRTVRSGSPCRSAGAPPLPAFLAPADVGLGLDLVPDLGEPLDVGAQLLLARRPRRRCAR